MLSYFFKKFYPQVVKKDPLCNINVWRGERNFLRELWKWISFQKPSDHPCRMGQKGMKSSRWSWKISRPPRNPPRRLEITEAIPMTKTRIYIHIQHEPAFPDDKFRVAAGSLLPAVQRWRLILRGPQYWLTRITIRVFVVHKTPPSWCLESDRLTSPAPVISSEAKRSREIPQHYATHRKWSICHKPHCQSEVWSW